MVRVLHKMEIAGHPKFTSSAAELEVEQPSSSTQSPAQPARSSSSAQLPASELQLVVFKGKGDACTWAELPNVDAVLAEMDECCATLGDVMADFQTGVDLESPDPFESLLLEQAMEVKPPDCSHHGISKGVATKKKCKRDKAHLVSP